MGNKVSKEHPLVEAWQRGQLNAAAIQRSNRVPIDAPGVKGHSVLTLASHCGDLQSVKLLMTHSANPVQLASHVYFKRTPFHLALANRNEHVGLYMYTSNQSVRGIVFTEDGLKKTPIKIAAQKDLFYMLWVMMVHCHTFTPTPYKILNDYRTWTDLKYTQFNHLVRLALRECNSAHSRRPLLFASFGLPATVHVDAVRHDFNYHSANTQGIYSLWPKSNKYLDFINLFQQPMLSTNTPCQGCGAHSCVSNECVLTCYLANTHQLRDFIHRSHFSQPDIPTSPQRTAAILNDINNFILTTNQNEHDEQHKLLNIIPTPKAQPPPLFVLPPPIFLTSAINKMYTCTRNRCVCNNIPGSRPMCYLYPPLISVPTYPLSQLTPGGYHDSGCDAGVIDHQQKTSLVSSTNPQIIKEKTNQHAVDVIGLHLEYIDHIHRIFAIQPTTVLKGNPKTTQFSPLINSPGFSVPMDYTLARYLDTTTAPVTQRPKNFSEKASGFFSGMKSALGSIATSSTPIPKFEDGSKPTSLDQYESVLVNNIRYHANRNSVDSKFTTVICGPKRDYLTPIRLTEPPVDDAFTSLYPPNAPQIANYESTPPVLNSAFSTAERLVGLQHNKSKFRPKLSEVTGETKRYRNVATKVYPKNQKQIVNVDKCSDYTILSEPIAPVGSPAPNTAEGFQSTHSQTCLCGAHTCAIQPVQLEPSHVNLNMDGTSLRITQQRDAEMHMSSDSHTLSSVLFTTMGPQTSITYRPAKRSLALNTKLFDYGFPGHHILIDQCCPPLNPTHDTSTVENNGNKFHDAVQDGKSNPNHHTDHRCPMGALHSWRGSIAPRVVDDDDDLGDVVVSPNHHVTISIPIRSISIVYLTSALHRVLQAKYPHYLLLSQWHRLTTRIAGAVQRVAQRRLSHRMLSTEVNMLNIFNRDLTYIIKAYEEAYSDYITSGVSDDDRDHLMRTSQRQFILFRAYLSLLDKYATLRQYRLLTSQFTPGGNVMALLGNVIATAEHDVELYEAANPVPLQPASTNSPHPGSQSEPVIDFRQTRAEAILTSRVLPGGGVLSTQPTPLPPGLNPNEPIPDSYTCPPGSVTVKSFTAQAKQQVKDFIPLWHARLNSFQEAYPRLFKEPNSSPLAEIDVYLNSKQKWASRNGTTTTTTLKEPLPLDQPFTAIEDFTLDLFVAIIPRVIQGFTQRIGATIARINGMISSNANPHGADLNESIAILSTIQNQASLLESWLTLPTTPPHFHTRVHPPAKRQDRPRTGEETPTTTTTTNAVLVSPSPRSSNATASEISNYGGFQPQLTRPSSSAQALSPSLSNTSYPSISNNNQYPTLRNQYPSLSNMQYPAASSSSLHPPLLEESTNHRNSQNEEMLNKEYGLPPPMYDNPIGSSLDLIVQGYESGPELPPSYEYSTTPSQRMESMAFPTFKYFSDDIDNSSRSQPSQQSSSQQSHQKLSIALNTPASTAAHVDKDAVPGYSNMDLTRYPSLPTPTLLSGDSTHYPATPQTTQSYFSPTHGNLPKTGFNPFHSTPGPNPFDELVVTDSVPQSPHSNIYPQQPQTNYNRQTSNPFDTESNGGSTLSSGNPFGNERSEEFFDPNEFLAGGKTGPESLNRRPSPQLSRRTSVDEATDYLLTVVKEEPAIIYAMMEDPSHIDAISKNLKLMLWLSSKRADIWKDLTTQYPAVKAAFTNFKAEGK